jgi:hypothetical protein
LALEKSVSTAPGELPLCRAISSLEKPAVFHKHTRRSSAVIWAKTSRKRMSRSICSGVPEPVATVESAAWLSSAANVRCVKRLEPRRKLPWGIAFVVRNDPYGHHFAFAL